MPIFTVTETKAATMTWCVAIEAANEEEAFEKYFDQDFDIDKLDYQVTEDPNDDGEIQID